MALQHDDRRKSLRTTVDIFVEIRGNDRTALHPATDLSTTGLYLLASDDHGALDPSRPLELELTLPTGVVIRTHASVAYIDDRFGQRGIGLEFIDLSAHDHLAIERFVDASAAAHRRIG